MSVAKFKSMMGDYGYLRDKVCLNSLVIRSSMAMSLIVSVVSLNYLSSLGSSNTARFLKVMNWLNIIFIAFNILYPAILSGKCANIMPWAMIASMLISLVTAAVAVDFLRKSSDKSKVNKFLLAINIIYLIVIVLTLAGGLFKGKDLLSLISIKE